VPVFLVGVMALVTLGSGGIKPNVVTLGANQFDPKDPSTEENKKSFFQYFYLAINLGSIISHGYLSSAAVSGAPSIGVPVEDGYFYAYCISASFMLFALLTFIFAKRFYRKDEAAGGKDDGIMKQFLATLMEGSGQCMGKIALLGWFLIPCIIIVTIVNAFAENDALKTACLAIDVLCILCLIIAHQDNSWLPQNGITAALDCVPVIVAANVCYGTVEFSIGSFFQSSACQMDTRLHKDDVDGFQFSGDFFRLANPIAIILWTPILDSVIYPTLKKCLGRDVSAALKITGAYLFAMAAQGTAAMLETIRLGKPVLDFESRCAPTIDGEHVHGSDMNAFWMLVPYAVAGMGEIMVYPVIQHLAYQGAPVELKSLMQAFCLFTMGALPNAVASAISQGLSTWMPNNLNEGNLPLAYLVNCSICLLGLTLFWTTWCRAPIHVKLGQDVAVISNKDDDQHDHAEPI